MIDLVLGILFWVGVFSAAASLAVLALSIGVWAYDELTSRRRPVRPVRRSLPLRCDDRPLLTLVVDERRVANDLYRPGLRSVQAAPATYTDGSMDELTRAFDVIADALAAPGDGPGAA